MPVNPVIVIPGITAAYLDDRYPLPPENIWAVLSKNYERAALHPDNLRFEATEPALVRSGQLFEVAYRELIEELRHNLSEADDEPVPVYPFSYDWRQPLETAAAELTQFVDEVITCTALLCLYANAGYGANPKVNLVGHSMGGLVILTYLRQAVGNAKVGKVVTLATPFRGSFESVIKITTGTANLGTSAPSSREREAARMTPSLYCLLPDLPNAVMTEGDIPNDLFDPSAWQPSIIDTIEEYIRLRGLSRTNRRQQAIDLLGEFLSKAKTLRNALKTFKPRDAGVPDENWLCIIGVDAETRVRLKIGRAGRAPEFEFDSVDRQNKWSDTIQTDRHETGDGTVPYDAALPYFLKPEQVVCVSPDDYGYWEVANKLTTKLAGFHGILPNMDMLHRLIVRYFKERRDPRENTWGRLPIGVSEDAWDPPLVGKLKPKT